MSNSLTYRDRIPIFEWFVLGVVSKTCIKKNTCVKENELHAKNLIAILSSTIILIEGDLRDCPLNKHENVHFHNEE